jgi:MoxR-like ATPase
MERTEHTESNRAAERPEPPRHGRHAPLVDVRDVEAAVERAGGWIAPLRREMARVIVGQEYLIDRLMVGLLTNGHLLLEGVPGLAKTLALKTLAQAVAGAQFKRIQFTPDMLPADIVGTMIFHPHDGSFQTKHGPIFANLILADEINRAPAKVQSALLEAMQERQVTLGDTTYRLPDPFLVLATQNPLEQEGTYPLPEAQTDRFLLKLLIDYPNRVEERAILDAMAVTQPKLDVDAVLSVNELLYARGVLDRVYVDDKVRDYIVELVAATRRPTAASLGVGEYIRAGASPRATISLMLAAKAWAFVHGRGYVVPMDVKTIAPDALRHRLVLTYAAEAEGVTPDDIINKIFDQVRIP